MKASCVVLVIEAHGNVQALLDSEVVFKKKQPPTNSSTNELGKEYTPIFHLTIIAMNIITILLLHSSD